MPAQACYATGRAPCIAFACESGALYEASIEHIRSNRRFTARRCGRGSALTDRRGLNGAKA
jgi:hypothetical protein